MQKTIEIKITDPRIGTEFPLPAHATPGSAGVDLRALIEKETVLAPNETLLVPAGFEIYIRDHQFAGLVLPRSGLGAKHGIILANSIGLIDSDYQGQLFIPLLNRSSKPFRIRPGDRVAQMILIPIVQMQFEVVTGFKATVRGAGSFGHTGEK